jgi:hypothetical protein
MTSVRKSLALGVLCLFALLGLTSPASATSPSGSLLKITDLPTGWVPVHSPGDGPRPPCLAAAESPLARFPEVKIADVGGNGRLAQLSERVVSVPRSILMARYSEVVRRFTACNGSSWTHGPRFRVTIKKRSEPPLGHAHGSGFSVTIRSPSTNVVPNPYPGLVAFLAVGNEVVILSMQFAGIPVDTSTFDSVVTKVVARVAG